MQPKTAMRLEKLDLYTLQVGMQTLQSEAIWEQSDSSPTETKQLTQLTVSWELTENSLTVSLKFNIYLQHDPFLLLGFMQGK